MEKNKKIIGTLLLLLFFVILGFFFFQEDSERLKINSEFVSNIDDIFNGMESESFEDISFGQESIRKAIEENDNSFCQNISIIKYSNLCNNYFGNCDDICSVQVAFLLSKPELCDNIKNKNNQKYCKETLNDNIVLQEALVSKNISKCQDSYFKNMCENSYNFQIGMELKDASYCNKVTSSLKEVCLENIVN